MVDSLLFKDKYVLGHTFKHMALNNKNSLKKISQNLIVLRLMLLGNQQFSKTNYLEPNYNATLKQL